MGEVTLNPLECALDEAQALHRQVDALQAENAKLREEAERAWRAAERLCQAFDGPCRDDGTTIYKPCPMGERDEECVYGQLQRDLRELGGGGVMCNSNKAGETTTVNAIVYDVGHVAVLMPDERPIKHVVLEAPAERGMVGDLTWRYYIPESYAATLANENAKLRELCKKLYRLADESYVPFKDVNPWMNEFDNAIRAMRELGIEVDE